MNDVVLLNGIEYGGTFGDDDNIGAEACTLELAQVAIRQNMVIEIWMAVLRQQDVDARLDGAVLEDVVEDDKLGDGRALQRFRSFHQPFHTLYSLLAYCHLNLWEFAGNHGGLVSQEGGIMVAVIEDVAFALAFVATAEHGRGVFVGKQSHKIFHMWSLAGAASRKIPHTNRRDVGNLLLLDA